MSALLHKLSTAARFWERLRIYFNFWLACILLFHFLAGWPYESIFDRRGESPLPGIFLVGLIANFIYSFAYMLDLLIQRFAAAENWRTLRLVLYWYGMLASGIMMNLVAG